MTGSKARLPQGQHRKNPVIPVHGTAARPHLVTLRAGYLGDRPVAEGQDVGRQRHFRETDYLYHRQLCHYSSPVDSRPLGNASAPRPNGGQPFAPRATRQPLPQCWNAHRYGRSHVVRRVAHDGHWTVLATRLVGTSSSDLHRSWRGLNWIRQLAWRPLALPMPPFSITSPSQRLDRSAKRRWVPVKLCVGPPGQRRRCAPQL